MEVFSRRAEQLTGLAQIVKHIDDYKNLLSYKRNSLHLGPLLLFFISV